ncbi:hypothetical protein D046_2981B, partial [Vibrio parahaemolyticus V-223/04]
DARFDTQLSCARLLADWL